MIGYLYLGYVVLIEGRGAVCWNVVGMLMDKKMAFIGSGVMAEAMVKGLIHGQLIEGESIICSDPVESRGEELRNKYGVRSTTDNAQAVSGVDIVVLSVKPQVLGLVFKDLQGKITPEQLIISIVAGVTTDTLRQNLQTDRVIRVMPNTPAQVGEGMSVWTCPAAVSQEDREVAATILRALGKERYVRLESEMDMATALSGTGPAYVFLFMEALIDAGVHMGFSRRVAEELVLQTVKGSVDFAIKSGAHLAELRNMVTSPGGTTADALYHLEKGGLRTVISRAVFAAYKKSEYLSRLSEE